jgi:hypothetical protein
LLRISHLFVAYLNDISSLKSQLSYEKKLLALPLLLVMIVCNQQSKYPSQYQAKDTCEEWDRADLDRLCEEENVTNQFLGISLVDDIDGGRSLQVVKHFR